jgi:hypothetical protein
VTKVLHENETGTDRRRGDGVLPDVEATPAYERALGATMALTRDVEVLAEHGWSAPVDDLDPEQLRTVAGC